MSSIGCETALLGQFTQTRPLPMFPHMLCSQNALKRRALRLEKPRPPPRLLQWMDRSTQIDRRTDRREDGRVDGQTNRYMSRWIDGSMKEWMDG